LRPAVLILVSLFLVNLLPLAAAQDDAGTGADAPDNRANALSFNGTDLTGTLDDPNGDSADWYLMTGLPAHQGLSVDLQTTGLWGIAITLLDQNGNPFLHDQNGQLISGYYTDNFGGAPARYHFDIIPSPGAFYLGITRNFWSNQGTYEFNFTTVALADLAVDSITITPVTIQSDLGPLPASVERIVNVTVENHGAADAPSVVDVWVNPANDPSGSRRHVGTISLTIPAGQSRTVLLEWQTTGELGDMDVHAHASTHWEANLGDNELVTRQFVLVGQLGQGVDLLNHNVDADGVASAGTSYGRGTGAGITLPLLGTTSVGQYDP